jgi:hypothetical protein
MSDESQPIELELTPEQQAIIRRASGQQAKVLQININPDDGAEGSGRILQFRWRLSDTTGIPRLNWSSDKSQESD